MAPLVKLAWASSKTMIAIATLMLIGTSAYGACDNNWVDISISEVDADRALTVSNINEFPLTYSLRVRSDALQYSRSQRFSGTLRGGNSEQLMTLPADIKTLDEISISCRWTVGDRDSDHDDDYHYVLPYAEGTSYRVLQSFGSRFSHRGSNQYAVDFKMSVGTPVHAARDGVVARVVEEHNKGCWEDGCGRFANFIVVLHDDGTTGEYYHLQQNGALVDTGDHVTAGQKIGLSGNTGHTTMPHLHFAVYKATRRAGSQSVPVSFLSEDGVIHEPRRGRHYLAVMQPKTGD